MRDVPTPRCTGSSAGAGSVRRNASPLGGDTFDPSEVSRRSTMNSALYRFLTLITVVSLAGVGMLHAQTAVTGAIEGNVTDASGAAVAGATVEATNVGDAVTRTTVTNNDGAYRFPSLIPGTYVVTVKKEGFAQFTREGTRIDAGIGVRIDAK